MAGHAIAARLRGRSALRETDEVREVAELRLPAPADVLDLPDELAIDEPFGHESHDKGHEHPRIVLRRRPISVQSDVTLPYQP